MNKCYKYLKRIVATIATGAFAPISKRKLSNNTHNWINKCKCKNKAKFRNVIWFVFVRENVLEHMY